MCDENVCENEIQFMFSCKLYQDLRAILFENVSHIYPQFLELSDIDKLRILMKKDVVKHTAGYIWKAYNKRKKELYTFR